MSTETLAAPARRRSHRPGAVRLLAALTGHALASFLRTPTASFFTLIFPVSFLVIVGSTVGGQVIVDGVRVSQYLVAPFMVFGVAEGAFCVLAVGTATLRDSGVFQRLRAVPVPMWAVLTSRIIAAGVMSLVSAAILVAVGVSAYGVDLVWGKAPAAVITLVLGIVCSAALGLAVVALTRTVLAAQALTNGVLIPLAFISHVFIAGVQLPAALEWVSRALPLRHFADAMAGTFDPLTPGDGFAWGDLAALAAWAIAGIAVALWRFDWIPRGGRRVAVITEPGPQPGRGPGTGSASVVAPVPRTVGRPSSWRLLGGQVGHALTDMGRERLPVFFAVVFPTLLLLLFPAVIPVQTVHGMGFADSLLPGMIAYAIAVAGYVNLAEAVAHARASGVLLRLRSAPVPTWVPLGGRVIGAVLAGAAASIILVVVAVTVNGFQLAAAWLPLVALAVVWTGTCFGALGLALVRLLPTARTVTAITLGTLVPLSFVSDVFYVGAELPRFLQLVGDAFPLKGATQLFVLALRPVGHPPDVPWASLAVLAAWTIVGVLVAYRGTRGDRP
jgi:ABC-2 type transport system permease protein